MCSGGARVKAIAIPLAVMVATSSARAQDGRTFGDAGEFIPSGSLSFAHTSVQDSFAVSPGLQYFVIRDLAVGVGLLYAHSSSFDTYGGSASIGYNVRLASTVSVFPQVSFSALHSTGSAPSTAETFLGLQLFTPVLFHPAPHFFFGIGPAIGTAGISDLFHDQSVVVQTVIGGWL
jgi:hypothetical protein